MTDLDPPYQSRRMTSQLRKWFLQQKHWKTGRQRGKTTCLQNFGKQFVSKTLYVVSGPFACAIRCGAVDMFRTTGMKQWCRQFSKKETRLLVKIIARSHYWQSVTSCSLQFCFANWKQQAQTQEFGLHNSGFELAEVVQMLCLLQDVARRLLERTCAAKDGSLVFLALDWAKAFDSISPDGLIVALRRFGIPDGFCAIIRAIYSGCRFVVRDAGHTSEPRPQDFGISQGCPLSPFLFLIVITVLLFDASAKFAMEVETRQSCVLLVNKFVYADDTLVVDTDPWRAETHMRCIEAMGMNYDLRLNWKKCEVLLIGCEASIVFPDGSYLTCKLSILYLGSYLDASGAGGPEICRRLGEAKGQLDKLVRVWRHSTLYPQKRSVFCKLVSCQSCCIACTQWGWIRRNCGKLMGFKQSTSVLSFISYLHIAVVF